MENFQEEWLKGPQHTAPETWILKSLKNASGPVKSVNLKVPFYLDFEDADYLKTVKSLVQCGKVAVEGDLISLTTA